MIRQYDVSVFRIWMITQMFFSFFRKSDLIFPPTSGNPIFFKYFALIQKQTRPSEIYGGVTPLTQYDGCCTMSMAAINGMDRMGYQTILNHLKPFEQPARKIQVTNLDIVDKLGMGDICHTFVQMEMAMTTCPKSIFHSCHFGNVHILTRVHQKRLWQEAGLGGCGIRIKVFGGDSPPWVPSHTSTKQCHRFPHFFCFLFLFLFVISLFGGDSPPWVPSYPLTKQCHRLSHFLNFLIFIQCGFF